MIKHSMAIMATTAMVATFAAAANANAQQTPDYLRGSSAVPMTQSEMDNIRGEAIPAFVIAFVARRVAVAVGAWAGVRIADMLRGDRLPTYAEYRAAFGPRTATVLRMMPSYLRPRIAR